MQKLKQQLEQSLKLISELSLELTDAEKLDAAIKLLPYLESVSQENYQLEKTNKQLLPETLPEGVQKYLTKQLYEKYVSWCELQRTSSVNFPSFAGFLYRLNVEHKRNNEDVASTIYPNIYDVLESEAPKWPQL